MDSLIAAGRALAAAAATLEAHAGHANALQARLIAARRLVLLGRLDPRLRSRSRASTRAVVVLVPPIDGAQASLVALLSDGAAWSTSALALALGASQRTVQRALAELEATHPRVAPARASAAPQRLWPAGGGAALSST